MMPQLATFDWETQRISLGNVCPEPIVCVFHDGEGTAILAGPDNEKGIAAPIAVICELLESPDLVVANHFIAFDLGVTAYQDPSTLPTIFASLCDRQNVHCTKVREKLLALTDTGDLDFYKVGERSVAAEYGLAALIKRRFQEDRTAEKEAPDSWRLNFSEIAHLKSDEYPQAATAYLVADAKDPYRLWMDQERRRQQLIAEMGVDPFAELSFRTAADFCFVLMSAWGCSVDRNEVLRVRTWLDEELQPERTNLLVDQGILIPAVPPRAFAKGAKNPDGSPKMTKGSAESVSHTKMREYVVALADLKPEDVTIKRTDASEKYPDGQISFDAEWLDEHFHLDPVLEQFRHRQSLQKVKTTDLPRLMLRDEDGKATTIPSHLVHPNFDVLKRTGRSSSFAGDLYPSLNCQNVHPKVRNCIVPRPGYLLLSIDYSQIELVTWAQKCLTLFGHCVLADKINAGVDVHAYLGSQIALRMSPEFAEACIENGAGDSADEVYRCFKQLEENPRQELQEFYYRYRKLAKPTGLGFPGGLGPKTFIAYAKATYDIVIDLDTAKLLRQVWFDTFIEAKDYFSWIADNCRDARNSPRIVRKRNPKNGIIEQDQVDVYAYSTAFGLYRSGADFCAACNGVGLQSPAADGVFLSLIELTRACYDPSQSSILYDDERGARLRPLMMIHDEFVFEIRNEPEAMQPRIVEAQRIMVDCMKNVCPDVAVRTDAALMEKWDGGAKPVRDTQGNLLVWYPKEKQ